MDTRLQYFGRYRLAEHCGTLHGRDVYFLDADVPTDIRRVIVRRSEGTPEQATPICEVNSDSGLEQLSAVEWSDSEAAARAKAWLIELWTERANKLLGLADILRSAEGSR